MGPVAHSDIDLVENVSSTPAEEYRALSSGAGLIDRTGVGRLIIRGEDALDLLDRLSTNELATLEVGSGAATVLTTNKGRIIDLLLVHRGEDSLTVFTSPGNQTRVAEWIDFYTFVEDVVVEDRTFETAMLSLSGSASLLDDLTDGQASLLGVLERLLRTSPGCSPKCAATTFSDRPPTTSSLMLRTRIGYPPCSSKWERWRWEPPRSRPFAWNAGSRGSGTS